MKHKILKGFTMVELLVAMAIIGLLIATAIWGIGIAQQGARNTQRREAGAQILAGATEYFARFNQQPRCVTRFDNAGQSFIRYDNRVACAGAATQQYDVPLAGNAVVPHVAVGTNLSTATAGNNTTASVTEYNVRVGTAATGTSTAAPAGVNIYVCVCMEGGGFSDLSEPQGGASRTACATDCP